MNNRRKILLALGAAAYVAPLASFAQPQTKIWRIGYLDFGSEKSSLDAGFHAALIEGLHQRGYSEGRDFSLDARYAGGDADRLNQFAAEFARQKVDVIVAYGGAANFAAKRATTTIPIVIVASANPVLDGFAASLARPGGNITGMTGGADDTAQKLVELISLAAPKSKRVAVLINPSNISHQPLLARVQEAAQQAGKLILPSNVRTSEEIERSFVMMGREHADAVIILIDAFLLQQRAQIAGLAIKHKLPSIYATAQYAEAGGLMSYGADITDNFRRAGIFVDKILKGAKPGDIPFEQPTRYFLTLNRKTAKAIGLAIPSELQLRADKVIE
jgi:putative tryptophan/tyrosine transport system substrate-binding protein